MLKPPSQDSLPTQVGWPHDLQFNPQMFVEISQLMQQAAMEQHGAAYILTQDSEMSAFGPHWSSVIKKVGRALKTNHHIFWRELNQNKSLERQYSNMLHHFNSLTTNIWRKKTSHFHAPPSTNQGHWCYVFHHHLSTSNQLNQPERVWVQGEIQNSKNPGLESRPSKTIEQKPCKNM